MTRFMNRRILLVGLGLLGAGGVWSRLRKARARDIEALYATPLVPPTRPMAVYHLGHSLVGRDMPAMLAQLAAHSYDSQLGWGTSLKEHWEPDLPINGFGAENDHPRYRDARDGIGSGDYGAVVLTEMVEIQDAIRYHDSASYLARWAGLAWDADPQTRIYLYETWHRTDDKNGWLARIDRDLRKFWQGRVKYPALASTDAPIHLIPAGQVMGAVVRAAQADDGPEGISTMHDLFATSADGTPDTIHFNDLGAYIVALTHYAVLYHRSPEGLAHQLNRADGTPADAPSAATAAALQRIVWDVVRRHPETGVAA